MGQESELRPEESTMWKWQGRALPAEKTTNAKVLSQEQTLELDEQKGRLVPPEGARYGETGNTPGARRGRR